MATITKLSNGKFRVQVRKQAFYRNKTFNRKTDAITWTTEIEAQLASTPATGLPQSKTTLKQLIDHYQENTKPGGRTARACLASLSDRLGEHKLNNQMQLHVQDDTCSLLLTISNIKSLISPTKLN